ncbi:hypothetical protein GZH53_01040 [Flavihumibacter sp. R14]|nr:hypothetical protein [Flavihumibacter soli]
MTKLQTLTFMLTASILFACGGQERTNKVVEQKSVSVDHETLPDVEKIVDSREGNRVESSHISVGGPPSKPKYSSSENITNMEIVKIFAAFSAAVISIVSFVIARRSDIRSKKAENIKNLLGEKENVAFGALKLLRVGLPQKKTDRELLISALLQACLLEGSDRARALLYRVIEVNKLKYLKEFQKGLETMRSNFSSMDKYQFTKEELDLSRGLRRIEAIEKVINSNISGHFNIPKAI